MQKVVKVNLGCGPNAIKGWVNIDKSWRVPLSRFPFLKIFLRPLSSWGLITRDSLNDIPADLRVRRHDVSKGLPFNDNEVDYIFTSHMLEHLSEDKAIFVLKECLRILKNGGVLRVLVPDLSLLIKEYLKNKKAGDATAADRFIEGLNLPGTGRSRPLVNRITSQGHQWIYDFDSLAHRLYDAGFREVKKRESRKGEVPDLQLLGEGVLHPDSLYLEAKK